MENKVSENEFLRELRNDRILILDGGMGTMLQAAGMPAGMGPEKFCLANPDILSNIHTAYIEAGCDILTTCTFGSSKYKLDKGLNPYDVNRKLSEIARQAADKAGRRIFVAGDIGPTGLFVKPLGSLEPEELIQAFMEQIKGLVAGGVDLIFMETQFDLAEARAAAVAAKRVCDLPLMASMTFENGLSLTGSTPQIFAETMQNLGISVVGTNCSLGPDEMLPVVRELMSACQCPVMAEPNAGLPELRDGQTIFPLGPHQFAEKTILFAGLGAKILGGCCGTTPAHIKALSQLAKNIRYNRPSSQPFAGICLTSRSQLVKIGPQQPLVLIGERINPTGKPELAAQLQKGELGKALELADSQIKAGAKVLDVNVGAPLVNESLVLPQVVMALIERHLAPLSLDSSDANAIAAALPYCPGSCLVNSISGEPGRMESLGPLCRDFGAPFILLPLAGSELPVTAAARIAIAEELLAHAENLGIPRRLIIIDILALTISASPLSGRESLKMAAWCAKNNFPTIIGLSNISFGLPARALLNSTFLALARGAGLDACIANPDAPAVADVIAAIQALEGHDFGSANFIRDYSNWKRGESPKKEVRQPTKTDRETLYEMILTGDRQNIVSQIEKELAQGKDPFALVNNVLIPAINEVGNLYETREYFLPQLIASAEAMQRAFSALRPVLEQKAGPEKRPAIVLATVEGDIHDIGKNIVGLLLGNYGFNVIDAGKDVPAAKIVELAQKHGASIIGLSALMTTTMPRMEDTIRLLREKNLPIKVIIGGAAVTQAFADAIGADAYCGDATESVRAAKKFLANAG